MLRINSRAHKWKRRPTLIVKLGVAVRCTVLRIYASTIGVEHRCVVMQLTVAEQTVAKLMLRLQLRLAM